MPDQLSRRLPLDNEFDQGPIHQQIALHAADACRDWAYPEVTSRLDVLLWPRDRGPVDAQEAPYRVTEPKVRMGIWRITLCAEQQLPAGVDVTTRDAVLRAQVAGSGLDMPMAAVDQVVQCGLFGEVIYR